MNVLVYDDFGVSTNSLKHTLYSLKKYLSQKYDVHTVNAKQLCDEPWQDNCACLVIPGGEDKFYQSKLHPVATEKIRNYVFQGGRYFGVCAGAYFASDQIEFERDTSNSVIGERNLKFFKGKAIGCLNEGFEYKKESGMMQALVSSPLGHHFYAYYNGGCYFSPWQDVEDDSFEIISKYQINLMSGIKGGLNKFETLPAAVCCKYGLGRAFLVGFHPEYDPEIEWEDNLFDNTKIVKTRKESNEFFIFLLDKLNLSANLATEISYLPKNMPIYVYFMKKYSREEIKALPAQIDSADVIFVKDMKKTTDFDVNSYKRHLMSKWFGQTILCSNSLSSTQTIMQRVSWNKFICYLQEVLPNGSVLIADNQFQGRGRGNNTWISNKGCLQFTFLLKASQLDLKSPNLVQYLVALSVVHGLKSMIPDLAVFIKWPNDIYAKKDDKLLKIGGIIVNSTFDGDLFTLMIGVGLNVENDSPSISIKQLVSSSVNISREICLALFFNTFEELYYEMITTGFPFKLYESYWLHSNQQVTLNEFNQDKFFIKGIDKDGFLICEKIGGLLEVLPGWKNETVLLGPDGNSFDMMKGLIKRK